jgi:hypothetical protein
VLSRCGCRLDRERATARQNAGEPTHRRLQVILESIGWAPAQPLCAGLAPTYRWIEQQVRRNAPQR